MTDETTITPKPTETIATTSTVTTERSGPPKPEESMIAGLSGRFFIAITFAFWMGVCMVILLVAMLLSKFPTDPTIMTAMVGLIAGFFTMGGNICSTYVGQNQKPKSQTP